MRFYLQQNVMCLVYQHPLLLNRSRGWTSKHPGLALEKPGRSPREIGGTGTTVKPEEQDRFEGGGPEAPEPARELIAIPLKNASGRGWDAA